MEMNFLFVILIGLFSSYILAWLMEKIGMPRIFGHMIVGMLLTLPPMNKVFVSGSLGLFKELSQLGLVFLLYYIGLNFNVKQLLEQSKETIVVSITSAIVPFLLGYFTALSFGYDYKTALVVGATMSVTAEAVSGAILQEMNMLKTRIGKLIISAGLFDDIFEILILILVATVVKPGTSNAANVVLDLVIFAGALYIMRFFFMPMILKMLGKHPSRGDLFTASFIIVLAMAVIAGWLSVGSAVGALLAGVILNTGMSYTRKRRKQENRIADYVEAITFGFLEPLFFIWIGMNIKFEIIKTMPLVTFSFIFVASVGKIIGGLAAEFFLGKRWRHGLIIGIGMNARGVMEIVAAEIARRNNIITQEIYSAIVMVAIATTIISPILFKYLLKWHKKIEEREAKKETNGFASKNERWASKDKLNYKDKTIKIEEIKGIDNINFVEIKDDK